MPGVSKDALSYRYNPIAWLRRLIQRWGIENWAKRYYGIYPAQVIDNADPENLGRVRAIIPALGIAKEGEVPLGQWISACTPSMGNNNATVSKDDATAGQMSGMWFPPDIGTNIWVCFQWGDPLYPVYMGGFPTDKNTSDTFTSPLQKGIRTRAGHFLRFDDNEGELSIMIARGDGKGGPSPAFFTLDKDGNVMIEAEDGSTYYMNAVDHEVTIMCSDGSDPPKAGSLLFLGDDKVTLATKSGGAFGIDGKDFTATGDNFIVDCNTGFSANCGSVGLGNGAVEPAVKGMMLMANLAAHMHPSPGFGIPVPPLPPPITKPKELSAIVKIA
jgi:hypothetical protein